MSVIENLSEEARFEFSKAEEEIIVSSRKGEINRARSISVGTSCGITELSMRSNDGTVSWIVLQPGETVELIHQLAANVGCYAEVKPREDFSSWRSWPNANQNSTS